MGLFGIAVACMVNFFLGAFWYSPGVFGTMWVNAAFKGRNPEGSPAVYLLALMGHACTVVMLNYLVSTIVVIKTIEEAVKVGLLLSGIAFAVQIPHAAFGGKTLTWFLIDQGYDVAVLLLSSMILVALA